MSKQERSEGKIIFEQRLTQLNVHVWSLPYFHYFSVGNWNSSQYWKLRTFEANYFELPTQEKNFEYRDHMQLNQNVDHSSLAKPFFRFLKKHWIQENRKTKLPEMLVNATKRRLIAWKSHTIYIMKFKQVSILLTTHFSSIPESIAPMKTDVIL